MLAPNTIGNFLPAALCPKALKSYSFLCKTKRRIIGTHNKLVNGNGGFTELLLDTPSAQGEVGFLALFRAQPLKVW
jgi:hypothetical protein